MAWDQLVFNYGMEALALLEDASPAVIVFATKCSLCVDCVQVVRGDFST